MPTNPSVYIAAPYQLKDEAIRLGHVLAKHGIELASSWLLTEQMPDSDVEARKDLLDVSAANVFVALNPAAWSNQGTGGRHVELGYALALQKPIVLRGARSNVFHHLPRIRVVDSDETMVAAVILAYEQERQRESIGASIATIRAELVDFRGEQA